MTTDRITMARLRDAVRNLNRMAGYPADGSAWKDGNYRSVTGAYALDAAYGGYRLIRYASEWGAETDITPRATARQTYDMICAYMRGWQDATKHKWIKEVSDEVK